MADFTLYPQDPDVIDGQWKTLDGDAADGNPWCQFLDDEADISDGIQIQLDSGVGWDTSGIARGSLTTFDVAGGTVDEGTTIWIYAEIVGSVANPSVSLEFSINGVPIVAAETGDAVTTLGWYPIVGDSFLTADDLNGITGPLGFVITAPDIGEPDAFLKVYSYKVTGTYTPAPPANNSSALLNFV